MSGNHDKINPTNTNPGEPPAESREGGRNAERGREELANTHGPVAHAGAGTRKLRLETIHTTHTHSHKQYSKTRDFAALHTI